MKKFGPLKFMNQQGFENANCLHNFDGKRHTNHNVKSGVTRKVVKKGLEEGEEEITYISLSSDALSQTVLRNWAYHLHKPPTMTRGANEKSSYAQVKESTNADSRVYGGHLGFGCVPEEAHDEDGDTGGRGGG